MALETARCFEEGVLTDVREADVGSILGFGFAPFTGGTLSYIDFMGADAFVALCNQFAKRFGPRFKPNRLLRDMAKTGDTFYERYPPKARTRPPDALVGRTICGCFIRNMSFGCELSCQQAVNGLDRPVGRG